MNHGMMMRQKKCVATAVGDLMSDGKPTERVFRSTYEVCAHCDKKKHCPTLFFDRMGLHACLDCACDAMHYEEVKQLREAIITILNKHCILHEGKWGCEKCQEVKKND